MRCLVVLLLGTFAAPSAVGAQYVTLRGTVRDSITRQPIEQTTVYLADRTSDHTSRDGRFLLRRVTPEEVILMIRRIGYSPRAIRLNLERQTGKDIDLGDIALFPVPVGMDEIAIESRLVNRNPRLNDFFRRLKSGRGDYITRQDIWTKNPMVTTEMLRAIPGISINCAYLSACLPATQRKSTGIARVELTCPMRVLLDGQPTPIPLDEIPPAWIAGIEVYRSSAFTPLELMSSSRGTEQGSSTCGTVVVWTGGDDY